MPASNINSYLQDARNNFDAIRPVPVCPDANQLMGQYQNAHISANCYYGYQDVKNPGASEVNHVDMDCEMMELEDSAVDNTVSKPLPKKRSADDLDCPRTKRLKEEKVQREKTIEPETNETVTLETNYEDLMESLYWNIHGGNIFHMIQCL